MGEIENEPQSGSDLFRKEAEIMQSLGTIKANEVGYTDEWLKYLSKVIAPIKDSNPQLAKQYYESPDAPKRLLYKTSSDVRFFLEKNEETIFWSLNHLKVNSIKIGVGGTGTYWAIGETTARLINWEVGVTNSRMMFRSPNVAGAFGSRDKSGSIFNL